MIESFLNQSYFGNTIREYLISLVIFLFGALIIFILKKFIIRRLHSWAERTESRIDNFIVSNINRFLVPLLYLGVLYFSVNLLSMPARLKQYIDAAGIAIFTFYVIRVLLLVINHSLRFLWRNKSQAGADKTSIKGISTFLSILIWTLGIIFLLDNLGFKISAVIAGLGIGGIAVALAAQAVLGDFFSYFVIFFDNPFQIGDFITVDDKSGTVEKIGIKTTRVQSVNGEQIIFPNSNLTNSRIHNYKRLQQRRVSFKLSVVYHTPAETLRQIPSIITDIIKSMESTTFDRAHFQSYGESGLIFEIVYFVTTPDYNKYMDIQQTINLRIYEEFEQRQVKMAYPSRTVYIENMGTPGSEREEIN